MNKDERIKNLSKNEQNTLNYYLQNLKQTNKSPNTIKSYENDLIQFIEWLNYSFQMSLPNVSPDTISHYLRFLSSGGVIKKTSRFKNFSYILLRIITLNIINRRPKDKIIQRVRPLGINSKKRHLSCLKNFFEYLKQLHEGKSKKYQHNPVREKLHGIKLKEVDITHTIPLLPKHWQKITDKLYRVEEKFLVHLLYFGGLRLTEIQLLNIEDFDDSTKTLNLKRKGGYRHLLKIQQSRKIFELLDLYLAKMRRDLSGPLFTGRNGERASNKTIYNRVMGIFKKCDLPSNLTPHSFRRACATNLYIETRDLLLVRDYLNHHDAKVTQTYIDSSQIFKDEESIHPDLNFQKLHSPTNYNEVIQQ